MQKAKTKRKKEELNNDSNKDNNKGSKWRVENRFH